MFKVLLACYANWDAAVEVPFILKKAGCQVDVFCSNKSWLLTNSYHDNWIDAGLDNSNYLENFLSLIKNTNYDWIILCDDVLINYMNQEINDEDLFKKILPLTKIENRQILSSKLGLSDFCKKNNIDTPSYVMYNGLEDLKKIKEDLCFPVINKLDFSFGGSDMFISNTYEEFESKISSLPINQNLLVQEFITGEEIPVEGLFYNGELVVYMSSNVLSYSTSNFSYTTRKNYYYNEALKPILIQLAKELGLHGFANMLYIFNKESKKYYLIEVDPRPNSWMAYSRFVLKGNFSEGIKSIISGEYLNGYKAMQMKKPFVEIALFYKDFRRTIWKKDRKGTLKWIFNIKGYWRFIPFYDKKLMKKIFSNLWKEIILYKWNKIIAKSNGQ